MAVAFLELVPIFPAVHIRESNTAVTALLQFWYSSNSDAFSSPNLQKFRRLVPHVNPDPKVVLEFLLRLLCAP